MRQGLGVKLLGRPSFGALDYSNMRPFTLPSGRRDLWYASTGEHVPLTLEIRKAGKVDVEPVVERVEASAPTGRGRQAAMPGARGHGPPATSA